MKKFYNSEPESKFMVPQDISNIMNVQEVYVCAVISLISGMVNPGLALPNSQTQFYGY